MGWGVFPRPRHAGEPVLFDEDHGREWVGNAVERLELWGHKGDHWWRVHLNLLETTTAARWVGCADAALAAADLVATEFFAWGALCQLDSKCANLPKMSAPSRPPYPAA